MSSAIPSSYANMLPQLIFGVNAQSPVGQTLMPHYTPVLAVLLTRLHAIERYRVAASEVPIPPKSTEMNDSLNTQEGQVWKYINMAKLQIEAAQKLLITLDTQLLTEITKEIKDMSEKDPQALKQAEEIMAQVEADAKTMAEKIDLPSMKTQTKHLYEQAEKLIQEKEKQKGTEHEYFAQTAKSSGRLLDIPPPTIGEDIGLSG